MEGHKNDLVKKLRDDILPAHYRSDLSDKVDDGYLLFKKGSYVALVVPFEDVPEDDFGSKKAKGILRSVMTCLPVFMEKGLFLIYYGNADQWRDKSARFRVDKTALRPVILQSIHFIDENTGENENSRTHWGPLNFGFCGELIRDIEAYAENF